MNNDLKSLLELQKIDADLHFLRDLKEKRPRELERERKKVEMADEVISLMDAEIKQCRMAIDKCELDIKQKDADIEKSQINLNTAKTNQEYQVLQDQIARLKSERAAIEEQVIARMEEIESTNGERDKSLELVEQVKKDYAEREGEVQGFIGEVDQKISTLESQRGEQLADVDGEALELYERVLRRYGDAALASVEGGVCQGCHMQVTKQEISKLMMGKDLIQCRNCVKILYLASAVVR